MIVAFTLFSAAGQVLLKFGTIHLKLHPTVAGLLTDFPLIGGMELYGVCAALMVVEAPCLGIVDPAQVLEEPGRGRREPVRRRAAGGRGEARVRVSS